MSMLEIREIVDMIALGVFGFLCVAAILLFLYLAIETYKEAKEEDEE